MKRKLATLAFAALVAVTGVLVFDIAPASANSTWISQHGCYLYGYDTQGHSLWRRLETWNDYQSPYAYGAWAMGTIGVVTDNCLVGQGAFQYDYIGIYVTVDRIVYGGFWHNCAVGAAEGTGSQSVQISNYNALANDAVCQSGNWPAESTRVHTWIRSAQSGWVWRPAQGGYRYV